MRKAVYGYIRVSDKSQVKGDGFPRQIKAIEEYAEQNDLEVIHIYKEKGVSGTLENRPALTEMMLDLQENKDGVKTVVIEQINRLARDVLVQENILQDLKGQGVDMFSAVDGDLKLLEDDPNREFIRIVLGAMSMYDKKMTVLKLKAARDRKRKKDGKCEGRKGYWEEHGDLIKRIKQLRRKRRDTGKRMPVKQVLETLQSETDAQGNQWTGMHEKPLTLPIVKNIVYSYTNVK